MRAAKRLKYGAEGWARNVVGKNGKMRGYKIIYFIEKEGKAPERFRQRCQKRFKMGTYLKNLLARLPKRSAILCAEGRVGSVAIGSSAERFG